MAKKFPVVQADSYEEMASAYQVLQVAHLDAVLKRYKVPARTRRRICAAYTFESGAFLDSGWLKAAGKRVFPTLCFAERPVDPDEGLGGITRLRVPSPFFAFHEYAGGAVDAYFAAPAEAVENIEHDTL